MKFLDSLLKELKQLELPADDYAVFGSAQLGVLGLRDCDDLDLMVRPRLWTVLAREHVPINGKCIRIGKIEIFRDWLPWFDDVEPLIDEAEKIDGIRFVRIERMLEWKKAFGRDKDLNDLELLRRHRAGKDD